MHLPVVQRFVFVRRAVALLFLPRIMRGVTMDFPPPEHRGVPGYDCQSTDGRDRKQRISGCRNGELTRVPAAIGAGRWRAVGGVRRWPRGVLRRRRSAASSFRGGPHHFPGNVKRGATGDHVEPVSSCLAAMITSGRSGVTGGRFDVVVDAGRGQQPIRAALVDPDPRLRRQVMAAPADTVIFQGAAYAVIGHGAVLQADAAARAEAPGEERAELTGAAVGLVRHDGQRALAVVP